LIDDGIVLFVLFFSLPVGVGDDDGAVTVTVTLAGLAVADTAPPASVLALHPILLATVSIDKATQVKESKHNE
jgi:hypothetical protein